MKIAQYVNKLRHQQKKQHYLQSQKQTFVCVYPYTLLIPPDLYVIHTVSHARAYINTFIHPKCHVLKRRCNDCVEILAYFLTQLIYISQILSLHPHPPPPSPIHKHTDLLYVRIIYSLHSQFCWWFSAK